MELRDLGFDDWFEAHAETALQPDQRIARITAVDRGAYIIRGEYEPCSAELAGKFRFTAESNSDMPCVGDWVCVEYHDSARTAAIHRVIPRKTFIRRKRAGNAIEFQMIAANIELPFIIQSCHYDFNVRRLDRYLVMASEGNTQPIIVLTKTDLITPDELDRIMTIIKDAGITAKIIPLSNATGDGISAFEAALETRRTYCMIGSSGVGKTTLLNRILKQDRFDTSSVSISGEGTHTTSRRQLTVLENGAMLIDTPGMRELGILADDENVTESFADIEELALQCKFTNCSHTQEPGCAVIHSSERGELNSERYNSFLKLRKESDFNQMSYSAKRKKDKAFGKSIRAVQKRARR